MPDEQRITRNREDAENPSPTGNEEENEFGEMDPAEANEFRREQSLLDAQSRGKVLFANLLPWAGIAIAGVAGAVIAIMLFHYLAPASWAWLSESQLDRLETALASSVVSALIVSARQIFLR